ncbi:MAG TPA: flagellin hook IN motif-containing protein [Vicinamibacterales bacterium]
MFELFGVGKAWEGAFRRDPGADRLTAVADSPISAVALKMSSASLETSDKARSRFQAASDALRGAFGLFARETKPVYTATSSSTRSAAALVDGVSARVDPFEVHYGVLQSSDEVNSLQGGITRQSQTAIGLDVTSPEAASRLSSNGNLGLDVVGAVSTKISRAEMNTATSGTHDSSSLTFGLGANTSSSTGTLSGTFTGVGKADDATALTVKLKRNATLGGLPLLGAADVEFEVKDQTGELVFSFHGTIKPGDQVYLGDDIGLSISFSAGDLKKDHTSTVTITRTPISVDANAKFNNANPALRPQFDNNAQVTSGSFKVNGTTIDVYADDSINSVISRINSSGAGVSASLSGDKITLVTNSNSDQDVQLTNDTSNFLKATRLDGASTVKGNFRDDERLLKDTSRFGTVQSGSFQINGVTISIDKDTDTLDTVLARINSSGAGVTASFDSSTNKIDFVGTANSEDLIAVSNDTTGFLAKANLSTINTVRGNIRDDRQILSKTTQFASVTTGSFTLNGVSISVNKDTDTLASIIDRVNNAGAGVTASYDAATDKLVFTRSGDLITLQNDTSGFLAAAKVATGTTTAIHEANPDAAFNGTGANAPMFDAGVSVDQGSFTVNGVSISVKKDDSINSVLAKITASAAGVTATYDSATELVTLTSSSSSPITVGGDTSGFLAAVKLAGAASSVSTVGYSSFTTAIGDLPEYSGVTAGTLTINGQAIAIDPATTTINGLVDAINGLAGLAASVNQDSGGINIWSESGGSLTLADTSGVLATLGISAGTYVGSSGRSSSITIRTGSSTTSNSIDVAGKASAAVTGLNEALGGFASEELEEALDTFVGLLRDHGIRGLQVSDDGDEVGLSVSEEELVNALNALNDDADLARALASTFERLSADVAAAAGWDTPAPAAVQTLSLADMSRAQLAADQTATSLLFLRSTLQPQESAETTQKAAMKAYGGTP